jgi:cytochrome P450
MLVDVLGIPREHVEQIKSWTTDVFALQGAGIASEHAVESGYRACTGFRAFCTELVRQRRQEPRDDVLSALARVDPEDESAGINEADVVGLSILMLAAGHESSTNLLGNSIFHVLCHPEARAWVVEHQGVTEDNVEEFARFETPFMSLIRRAKKPVLFSGKMVREGEYVFCMLSSANRDPRAFTQPDRLALDGSPRAHVGFSVGMHKCVGAFMARVVISQAVTQFFARYPDAKFNAEGCTWLQNLSTRGLAQFPVLPAG